MTSDRIDGSGVPVGTNWLAKERASAARRAELDELAKVRLSQAWAHLYDDRERLREALEFYADPDNWRSTLIKTVPPGQPNEGAQEWKSGPAIDGGERARAALNDGTATNGPTTATDAQFDGDQHG